MRNELVIIENVALRLVERRQQALLEIMQTSPELALQSKQVGPLAIGVGSLDTENLVE